MIRSPALCYCVFAVHLLSFVASAHGSALKSDETVVFLSGIGSQNLQSNTWDLQIHGWVYESEYHKPITSLFRRALGIRDDDLTPAEQATFRERAQYFLVDNERRKKIFIRIGEMTFPLAPSLPNGHFQTNLHVLAEDIDGFGLAALLTNKVVPFQTISSNRKVHPVIGHIDMIPPTGVSVISDIDDTIKISNVKNRRELLRNTFCRPYQPVAGMPAVYQEWQRSSDARFHYISASPWQIFEPLSEFIQTNHFPEGTFHLKQFRWKDQTFFDLFKSPERYKLATIEPLITRFPNRKFVLIGDSSEKDPEIYAALAREFPAQIIGIYIRDTTAEKRDSLRYRTAFAGLSTNLWQIFEEPGELPRRLR